MTDPYKQASDKFHLALGYCVAKWAEIEDQLFRLCWTALRSPIKQAAIIYYRTPSIDARLTLATELVSSLYPRKVSGEHDSEDMKRWRSLEADIRELLRIRNRLAHHPVAGYLLHDGEYVEGEFSYREEYFSDPNVSAYFQSDVGYYESLRGRHDRVSALKYDDLDAYYSKLADIVRRLNLFWHQALRPKAGDPVSGQET